MEFGTFKCQLTFYIAIKDEEENFWIFFLIFVVLYTNWPWQICFLLRMAGCLCSGKLSPRAWHLLTQKHCVCGMLTTKSGIVAQLKQESLKNTTADSNEQLLFKCFSFSKVLSPWYILVDFSKLQLETNCCTQHNCPVQVNSFVDSSSQF